MRFYLSSILASIFLTSVAFSEEPVEVKPLPLTEETKEVTIDNNLSIVTSKEHAIVQSRTLSEEIQKYMIAKTAQEEENSDQQDDCDAQVQTGLFANQYPQLFFPYSCHSISAVSTLGDSIALEDGSIWDVHPSATNEVMTWKESDALLIYPNRAWFSTYKYKICNQVLKTEVEANMTYGPIINGEFSLQVVAVDPLKNEIYLNDNSRWRICSSDAYLLNEWCAGDYIIVGTNNSWFCSLKNILINSNMYNHVRAQQF